MAIFELELRFSADLTTFLRSDSRDQGLVRRMLTEKTAVKDVIEACGVPHSEVDLIVAVETYGTERYAVHFGWPVQIPMRLEIFGVPAPADVFPQSLNTLVVSHESPLPRFLPPIIRTQHHHSSRPMKVTPPPPLKLRSSYFEVRS